MASISATSVLLYLLCFPFLSSISGAAMQAPLTFTYVNTGDFGDSNVEYNASYRPLSPFTGPFQLCFYNTTPNAYTLALRMGTLVSESLMRWVWEANRGNPVRENATLTLRPDGNLVLADADCRIAWQTNTANKGVVGFQLLPTGNMVLRDLRGNVVWQSFDYLTDTLLVGQSLLAGGKLVSRSSDKNDADGPYSLVMEPKGLALYYKSPNSPSPIRYWSSRDWFTIDKGNLSSVTLSSVPDGNRYDLTFHYYTSNPTTVNSRNMAYSRYSNMLSYLRLGEDGNLRFFTYNPNMQGASWEQVYAFMDKKSMEGECQLPERCGNFGLCENSQCVACPTPNGLNGWTQDCQATNVTCDPSEFGYYELEGVDHFMIKYTTGEQTTQDDCENKCTDDCKCMGYFYHIDESRCWIAYDLKTLTKVGNSTHLAYIKTPNTD